MYSAVLSLIYELAAIAYASTKFDVFFNWNSYSSYKLMNLDVLPAGEVTSIQVMFVYWILMALMIAITCFIGIIFEIIFSSDVISGVAVIIFAGVDIFIPLTYHKLIIFGLHGIVPESAPEAWHSCFNYGCSDYCRSYSSKKA